jgi:4-carboxymuconolactone decarboxylase
MEDDRKNHAGDATKADAGPLRRTIERPTEPRLPLMDVSVLSQDQRTLAKNGASNVLRMLARRPDVLASWLEFGVPLTRIPMRTRELLILRIALRCSCEYEWANHVPGALVAGVTATEIASLAQGIGSWSVPETAGLHLVDGLCADDCASEETWKELTETYDEGEIIELLMLIGFYRMTAGFLNSLGVPTEPGRPRLGEGMSYEAPVPRQQLTDASTAEAKPDGTWHLKFYHPAITQELRLVVVAKEGELSGTLTNETTGNTTPLSEGKVQGHQVTFTTVTASYSATVVWDGTIEGDFLAGTVNVKGMGSFPLEGTRVE